MLKQIPNRELALIEYLKGVTKKDAELTREYHDFQIEAMVEYAPDEVLPFLKRSVYFDVDKVLALCKAGGGSLNKAVVYLLAQLGRHKESLDIIFDGMADFGYAIVRPAPPPRATKEMAHAGRPGRADRLFGAGRAEVRARARRRWAVGGADRPHTRRAAGAGQTATKGGAFLALQNRAFLCSTQHSAFLL